MLEPDPDQRATRVAPLLDQLREGARYRKPERPPSQPPRGPWATREEWQRWGYETREHWQRWGDETREQWQQWATELAESFGAPKRHDRHRHRHDSRHQRHARRHEAHAERRAEHARRREARWRGRQSRRIHPLLMVFLLLGLTAAQLATWALFTVLLPTLLTLLSLFFGSGPRRAAERSRELGERGVDGLRHASAFLRGIADEENRRTPPRTRVDDSAHGRVRVDEASDEVDTEGEELEDEERAPRRARRS